MAKKLLALLLGVTLTISALTGCGQEAVKESQAESKAESKGESSAEESSDSTNEVVQEEIDPLGKYEEEITLSAAWLGSGSVKFFPGYKGYESVEDNYTLTLLKDYMGINVEYDWTSTDSEAYKTKWNLALSRWDLPDFGVVDETTYKMLVEADAVADMTELLDLYLSEELNELRKQDELAQSYMTFDGKILGIPTAGLTPDRVMMLYIRKDWLDKLNLEIPETIDDAIAVAQAFADNQLGGEGTYGFPAVKTSFAVGNYSLTGIMEGYGSHPGWVVNDSGELQYGYTMIEETSKGLLKLQEVYGNGLVNQDFSTVVEDNVSDDVVSGKVGMVWSTPYYASNPAPTANKKADNDAEWISVPIPTEDGSPSEVLGKAKPSSYLFVSKECEHPEAVIKIINFFTAINNEEYPGLENYKIGIHDAPDGSGTANGGAYAPTVGYGFGQAWGNCIRAAEVATAFETGVQEFPVFGSYGQMSYDAIVAFENGDYTGYSHYLLFRPEEGSFATIASLRDEGRILVDAYTSFATDTMTEKEAILLDALMAAMTKVVMGEDISVYEKAVEDWYANGGQIITDEVNEWYKAR